MGTDIEFERKFAVEGSDSIFEQWCSCFASSPLLVRKAILTIHSCTSGKSIRDRGMAVIQYTYCEAALTLDAVMGAGTFVDRDSQNWWVNCQRDY